MAGAQSFVQELLKAIRNHSGSVAISSALAIPAILGITGAAIDYASVSQQRSIVAAATDAAALSVGRQMTISKMNEVQIDQAARDFIVGTLTPKQLLNIKVNASTNEDHTKVTVQAKVATKSNFGLIEAASGPIVLQASSTAQVTQQSKLCLLSITGGKADTTDGKSYVYRSAEKTGIWLDDNSYISAPGCVIQTNIAEKEAFHIGPGARVTAQLICAVGGVKNMGGMVNAPVIDQCPAIKNPLDNQVVLKQNRHCSAGHYKNITYTSGAHTLTPGNYCGNITISGTAKVQLAPGTYTIQGQLKVSGDSELVGDGVGFYFWGGPNISGGIPAGFNFIENSLINISAPESGKMAGMLIWEGINGAAFDEKSGNSQANFHQINSTRAKRLTGTIYLPAGRLLISSPGKVADQSEFTVMVVNRLDLHYGPNLVLNSDYARSKVPVPLGLGPLGARGVKLVQ